MSIKDHPGWPSVIEALAHEMAVDWVYDWIVGDSWYGYPDENKPGEVEREIGNAKASKIKDAEAQVQRIIAILEKAEARRAPAHAISDKFRDVMFPAEMTKDAPDAR